MMKNIQIENDRKQEICYAHQYETTINNFNHTHINLVLERTLYDNKVMGTYIFNANK